MLTMLMSQTLQLTSMVMILEMKQQNCNSIWSPKLEFGICNICDKQLCSIPIYQLHFVQDWLRNPSSGALRQKSNIVPFQSCLDTSTSQYVNKSRHESINVHSICPDNQVRFMCHPSPPLTVPLKTSFGTQVLADTENFKFHGNFSTEGSEIYSGPEI